MIDAPAAHRCDRITGSVVRYLQTTSGLKVPALRLKVRPRGGPFGAEDSFQVDTGADVPFGIAPQLRDWLRSTGARAGKETIEWGPSVVCEVYKLAVLIEGSWEPFEAYYPTSPRLLENLVGRPVLELIPICLRPSEAALVVTRPR
jgi:hypothetical protein